MKNFKISEVIVKVAGLTDTTLCVDGLSTDKEAEQQGYHDALMLSHDDYLAEASGANLFVIIDGEVLTPKTDSILNGITRQIVLENLSKRFPVHQQNIPLSSLANADEVFLTGTAYEIMPVVRVDDTAFKPGQISAEMTRIYQEMCQS